ncbi:LTA synthase family protein [Flavobacterium sp. MK4S-17]|uniref:LTA synthase family protein n=1 Tax=Flavobacterium sp. MK4S-17 TaxID=2543737 RepID=UPI00135A003E|nr:LTA synthase family protein [Flavobacterium sp. MK4S-17]
MRKIKHLKPILNFIIAGLIITTFSRLVLLFIFQDRINDTDNYWHIFPIGLRFDIILLCYLSFLPFLLFTFLPDRFIKCITPFTNFYFILLLSLLLLMELSSPDFIRQYDTRPNRLFLDYLIYPKEVAGTLFKSYLPSIIATIVIMAGFIAMLVKFRKKLFRPFPVYYKTRLLMFPVAGFLLFFGARSSLVSKRPINASNAVFSYDQLTNCIGLNSLYTVAFAAYSLKHEDNAAKMYGKMDTEEAYARVKKYMTALPQDFTNPELPLLHIQKPDSIADKKYNIVIFLQESLGAEYVGCLGGYPLTPELDTLAKQGLLFTNLYCTGTRSVRGIEAVVTGFLPSPSESVVKLSKSQSGFFTLADLMKSKGYETSFIYGGMSNFDNMASFFNGNGFSNIIDEEDFEEDGKKYALKGTWGYSDEDLAVKANDYFKKQGDKPFFSLMFSTSNHEPFEFPDNRIKLYEQPKKTVKNAMKYADFSIGKFFDLARKEAYFKNTIFLVIADHNTRTYGKNLVPINKFHIPALVIGPGIPKGEKYTGLCSQIDIPPTLLELADVVAETPMPGRNLFDKRKNLKGRAIMQFHNTNAFRVGDKVVIMQPNKKPQQFRMKNDTVLVPEAVNKELAKDALAHVIAASDLYKKGKYRLDNKKRKQ